MHRYETIVQALVRYRENKAEMKEIRCELVRLMVEVCGIPQDEATRMDPAFLDGYLVGCGQWQAYRDVA